MQDVVLHHGNFFAMKITNRRGHDTNIVWRNKVCYFSRTKKGIRVPFMCVLKSLPDMLRRSSNLIGNERTRI